MRVLAWKWESIIYKKNEIVFIEGINQTNKYTGIINEIRAGKIPYTRDDEGCS